MLRMPDHGFYVGYFKKIPQPVKKFALGFAAIFLLICLVAPAALVLGPEHPGDGGYEDLTEGRLVGVVEAKPYPILRVPAHDGLPARAIMLAGEGKYGVDELAAPLVGKLAEASGVFVHRGDLIMLLIGGDIGLRATTGPEIPPAAQSVRGRWRLTGEICDGKCTAGAMRPGTGLAHKACANLCISGGVPPVLATTAPVDGSRFLLLAGADGGPLPARYLDRVGERVEMTGSLERRDDLAIFRVEAIGR